MKMFKQNSFNPSKLFLLTKRFEYSVYIQSALIGKIIYSKILK